MPRRRANPGTRRLRTARAAPARAVQAAPAAASGGALSAQSGQALTLVSVALLWISLGLRSTKGQVKGPAPVVATIAVSVILLMLNAVAPKVAGPLALLIALGNALSSGGLVTEVSSWFGSLAAATSSTQTKKG